MTSDKELNQHKKASKRAALVTLLAFILIAIAIVYNTTQLNSIEAANKTKLVEVDSLLNEIKKLDQTVTELMYSKDQRPHVYVDTLTEIKDINGRQLYDFTLWIDSGAFQKKDISRVEYKFNSSSVNDMSSVESSNGFSVHFRGTECLKNVDVTIVFSDGSNRMINFDMCEELSWSTMNNTEDNINMQLNNRLLVSGEIVIASEIDSFSGAKANVYLEDVSLQDAPSYIFSKQTITDLSHQKGIEDRKAFQLHGKNPDEQASYSVRVHIDLQGDGEVQRGDYITTQSYPVLTNGNPNQVTVVVHEVK